MRKRSLTRRDFLTVAGAAPLALAAACAPTEPEEIGPARLRLHARHGTPDILVGNDVLYGEGLRRAYIRVPPSYNPASATPLIIGLHGGAGRGDSFAASFGSRTDALGAILLTPNSAGQSWDMFEDGFGPDVAFINDVLDQAFDRCSIDASRVALMGFSDGASYAISLGIANGDALAGVVGFSPGTFTIDHPRGTPSYFVAHGTSDTVLPIDDGSRWIVPALRERGSTVTYVEFDGGHQVTTDVADQAMTWLDARV